MNINESIINKKKNNKKKIRGFYMQMYLHLSC